MKKEKREVSYKDETDMICIKPGIFRSEDVTILNRQYFLDICAEFAEVYMGSKEFSELALAYVESKKERGKENGETAKADDTESDR